SARPAGGCGRTAVPRRVPPARGSRATAAAARCAARRRRGRSAGARPPPRNTATAINQAEPYPKGITAASQLHWIGERERRRIAPPGGVPMAATPANRRSRLITHGVARSPNRAMLRAVGFGDGDFEKPIVGVANGQSTMNPCNAGIQPLIDRAMAALEQAGAKPQVFGVPTVTDGIGMGTEAMKYS